MVNKNITIGKRDIKELSVRIVAKLMKKFDDEIIPLEDPMDPARPSIFRDEFAEFLLDTIKKHTKISKDKITIGVGDSQALGFDEELDEETTDGIKIIGTIIQGISGEYVLVTSEMVGHKVGRFGGAFLLSREQYDREAISKGWDPGRPSWHFSNFSGLPDFFEIDISDEVNEFVKDISEKLKEEMMTL